MKNNPLIISLIVLLFFGLGCDDKEEPIQTGSPEPNYVSHSECKNKKSGSIGEDKSQDCITYSYQADTKILTLTHKNAAFNCCPDSITVDFSFMGDTILITEAETAALCNCSCVFDLNFTIGNLEKKTWIIKVVEPYIGDSEPLKGTVDLNNEITGEFCIIRNFYPWETLSAPLEASYISHSECKSKKSDSIGDNKSQDCITYSYQADTKMLTLTHKNAAFNCCPDSITADFSFIGDTIIITEAETAALCLCNCLYDLNFIIGNLEKKTWIIKVIEPYIGDGEPLMGNLVLANEMSGEFCVTRDYIPWE